MNWTHFTILTWNKMAEPSFVCKFFFFLPPLTLTGNTRGEGNAIKHININNFFKQNVHEMNASLPHSNTSISTFFTPNETILTKFTHQRLNHYTCIYSIALSTTTRTPWRAWLVTLHHVNSSCHLNVLHFEKDTFTTLEMKQNTLFNRSK